MTFWSSQSPPRNMWRLLENHFFVEAEKCELRISQVSFQGFFPPQGKSHSDGSGKSLCCLWLGGAKLSQTTPTVYQIHPTHAFSSVPLVPSSLRVSCILSAFFSALIFPFQDPPMQFLVEGDTPGSEVGAVLSQCFWKDRKLHTCAIFYYLCFVQS